MPLRKVAGSASGSVLSTPRSGQSVEDPPERLFRKIGFADPASPHHDNERTVPSLALSARTSTRWVPLPSAAETHTPVRGAPIGWSTHRRRRASMFAGQPVAAQTALAPTNTRPRSMRDRLKRLPPREAGRCRADFANAPHGPVHSRPRTHPVPESKKVRFHFRLPSRGFVQQETSPHRQCLVLQQPFAQGQVRAAGVQDVVDHQHVSVRDPRGIWHHEFPAPSAGARHLRRIASERIPARRDCAARASDRR
jgi:hypothetical protein